MKKAIISFTLLVASAPLFALDEVATAELRKKMNERVVATEKAEGVSYTECIAPVAGACGAYWLARGSYETIYALFEGRLVPKMWFMTGAGVVLFKLGIDAFAKQTAEKNNEQM